MRTLKISAVLLLSLLAISGAACGGDDSSSKTPPVDSGSGDPDAAFKTAVVNGMHDSITGDLANIVTAAQALQTAAPTHAWNAVTDADAITAMKTAWLATRTGYEHVEGATAPVFPDKDVTMDARYDDFMMMLAAQGGDTDLFDDKGVTGMHAIERILYAPGIRAEVIASEAALPGYVAASFPTTDAQAMEFKTLLCQKLITDAQALHDEWTPSNIDISLAYQGLVGLMNEQAEKVNLAATGEEESRYANVTLFDLRNNLAGTKTIYGVFQAWIKSKPTGTDPDDQIEGKFGQLDTLYSSTPGDALPDVPSDWKNDMPTAANLQTSFGMLWATVHADVALNTPGSVDYEMNVAATLLGLPTFTED